MCLQLGSTSSERSRTSYARGFIQLFLRYWLDSKVSGEKKPNIAHTALLNTVQRTCINYHGHQKPKVIKNLRTFYFLSKLAIHFSVYIHTYIVYIYTHTYIRVCVYTYTNCTSNNPCSAHNRLAATQASHRITEFPGLKRTTVIIEFQPPAMCKVTSHQTRLPGATSSPALNASRHGASTASLGKCYHSNKDIMPNQSIRTLNFSIW